MFLLWLMLIFACFAVENGLWMNVGLVVVNSVMSTISDRPLRNLVGARVK